MSRLLVTLRPCLKRDGVAWGRPNAAAAARAARGGLAGGTTASLRSYRSHVPSQAPRSADLGRAEWTLPDRAAQTHSLSRRPTTPLAASLPGAPGHGAPRAEAGFSPVWPPAPRQLGTQPIGQAGESPHPDWCERCLSASGVAVRRRAQLAPPIPARENSTPGIPGVSLPEAGF